MWLRRIFFQFSADVRHVDPENPVVVVRVGPPHMRNDGVIGHDPAGIDGEEGDDFKFHLGQMHGLFFHGYKPSVKIDGKPAGTVGMSGGHAARHLRPVAERCADACHQLR